MNSEERREKRYQNRQRARKQKRDEKVKQYDDFDRVASFSALVDGCRLSKKGVTWKASVQRYSMNLLRNTNSLYNDLVAGKNVAQGFIEFDLYERGKRRHIRSVHFRERCVQRSLCDNALGPVLERSLIYDNGASQKGKGIHFALKRLKAHLQQYYRQNGFSNGGYVLLIDFSKYFDNILHQPCYEAIDKAFEDKRILELSRQFIEPFGEKSLGLGSQVSQILAVAYPNKIDHFVKEGLRMKYYARYMDDSYIIHHDKKKLQEIQTMLIEMYTELGIVVNPRKMRIQKLSNGFTFLKVRYFLTDTGYVVMKPCRDSIVRMRRKLKKFKALVADGKMEMEDVRVSYNSWRGYISHCNSYRAVQGMDDLYLELFNENHKGGLPCL